MSVTRRSEKVKGNLPCAHFSRHAFAFLLTRRLKIHTLTLPDRLSSYTVREPRGWAPEIGCFWIQIQLCSCLLVIFILKDYVQILDGHPGILHNGPNVWTMHTHACTHTHARTRMNARVSTRTHARMHTHTWLALLPILNAKDAVFALSGQ